MSRALAALVFLCAVALPAAADKIILKSGSTYEGRLVRETGTELTLAIIVMGKTVEMSVARDQIESYEKTKSVLEQYEEKAAQVDRKKAEALVDLAVWCRDQQLSAQAAKHLIEALALKPDHEKAIKLIKAMGYVREGNTWVPEADQKRAQGLEKWGDQWLPKDQVAKLRAEQEATGSSKSIQTQINDAQRDLEATEANLKKLESDLTAAEKKLAVAERLEDIQTAQKEVEQLANEIDRAIQACESRLQNLEKLERVQAAKEAEAKPVEKPKPAQEQPR